MDEEVEDHLADCLGVAAVATHVPRKGKRQGERGKDSKQRKLRGATANTQAKQKAKVDNKQPKMTAFLMGLPRNIPPGRVSGGCNTGGCNAGGCNAEERVGQGTGGSSTDMSHKFSKHIMVAQSKAFPALYLLPNE
jgi:hypothetical protein